MTFRPGKRLRITSGARLNLAKLALALFVSGAGGCVMVGSQYTPPTQQQLAAVGYGAPLTVIGFRKWLVLFRDNQIVAVTYDGNSWSEWFYTESVKEGLHYGILKADESELQWHQSYHGAEFPWPNVS